MKALIFALLIFSGGGAARATEIICLQPSDRIVRQAPCDVQIQPILETDPWLSAWRQSLLGPNVMLWIGGGKDQAVIDRFPALIQAARQYPNIKSVYLYDEWMWDGAKVEIGRHENEVLWGANFARAYGLQTVVSILPQVILHPGFAVRDINAFDLIAIDPYPANGIVPTPGCTFDINPYSTALYCSYIKLRAMGYIGRIGYIAQGFGMAGQPKDELIKQLILQKQTIDKAFSMNVDAYMAWGLYLGPNDLADGVIYPLGRTVYEGFLRP